jgi:hypothetical protein
VKDVGWDNILSMQVGVVEQVYCQQGHGPMDYFFNTQRRLTPQINVGKFFVGIFFLSGLS